MIMDPEPVSTSGDQRSSLPDNHNVKDVHCYVCDNDTKAAECLDLEFRCQQCGSSSVEYLEHEVPHAVLPPRVPLPPVVPPPDPMFRAMSRRARERRSRRSAVSAERYQERVRGNGRHIGVICDGCGVRDFSGNRYRCLQCRDYDLCARCFEQRGQLHAQHPFEAIRTPRGAQVARQMRDAMGRGPLQTVVAIIEIGIEEITDMRTGLDDASVAWFLADDQQLADVDRMVRHDPTWTCPICAEGLEAEEENGWVVRICGDSAGKVEPTPAPIASSSSASPDGNGVAPSAEALTAPEELRMLDGNPVSYNEMLLIQRREGVTSLKEIMDLWADMDKADTLYGQRARVAEATQEEPQEPPAAEPVSQEPENKSKASTKEGHIFHEGCLRRWLIKKNSCPVCRHTPVMPPP